MVLIDMDELANLHVMYAGLLEPGARGLRDQRSHGEDYAHYITACPPGFENVTVSKGHSR